ncbi:MAG: UDP-N-acetylmuramoyl-L-alanine--D-glutamate ligase [Rhodospirillaceae bacterium]|nr:UDP-N-acetylmuramoyl-L-alanine--D-glutamate ligase [Rhodospirillaceae bacterium]
MIPVTSRFSQHIAVFGLGGSGRATAHALIAGGAKVTGWDDNADSRSQAANENVPIADLATADWSDFSALVLSPGIPLTHPTPHPVVTCAVDADCSVIGDIELLTENIKAAVLIGITGTNGKSTTSALLHHVLQTSGVAVQIGGNFGPPALGLNPPTANETVVLELSSYQLDLTHAATFDIAVLLNVTPDHLDRHGGMADYVAAKKRIFRTDPGTGRQIAVIGIDDEYGQDAMRELAGDNSWQVIPVSIENPVVEGISVIDGELHDADGNTCKIGHIRALRGRHNWQNAATAWAVARTRGLTPAQIAKAFKTYPGLPHRLEAFDEIDGIRYINDSKATNGEAAARAISSFANVYWIAGGVAKEDGLVPTVPYLKHVRHAFLIGESADAFATMLEGEVPVTISGDLATAVKDAQRSVAKDEDRYPDAPVVLLSPACAAFDQYENFMQRGDHFRDLVAALQTEGEP